MNPLPMSFFFGIFDNAPLVGWERQCAWLSRACIVHRAVRNLTKHRWLVVGSGNNTRGSQVHASCIVHRAVRTKKASTEAETLPSTRFNNGRPCGHASRWNQSCCSSAICIANLYTRLLPRPFAATVVPACLPACHNSIHSYSTASFFCGIGKRIARVWTNLIFWGRREAAVAMDRIHVCTMRARAD